MGHWIRVEEAKKHGVAIYNFWEIGQHHLRLDVGDTVQIILEYDEWYYGSTTRDYQNPGIFPKSFIHIKLSSSATTGVSTVAAKTAPLIAEITSVLREWGILWKQLYITSNRNEIGEFEIIWKKMTELIDWRRLIMSKNITNDEIKDLQQKITNKIDMGNAILGLDLVVRDEGGNTLDPALASTIGLYRQHQLAAERIQEEKDPHHTDHSVPKKSTSFNLLCNVKNFVCRVSDDTDVLVSLYDGKEGEFISENFVAKWGNTGMPRDIEMFNNLRVLFTDLGTKDSHRQLIYLVCQIIRIGRMEVKDNVNKKQTTGLRRPFGVAVFNVTNIIRGKFDVDDDKQFFLPFLQCTDRDPLDVMIKKAITAKDFNHKGQGVWVTLKKIYGDLTKLSPHLLTGNTPAAISRKMGFPDVILPGDVRNDIYVMLAGGEFKRSKTQERNIEVTMSVCNKQGEIIEGVISEGSGGHMVSQYKSVIYYHDEKPKWCETVKIAIPIDQFYGSHLKFTFKHRSSVDAKDKLEKPFSISYIKLMHDNGVTINDTFHDLLVYKIEGKKAEEAQVYLNLPSTRSDQEANGQLMNPKYQLQKGNLILMPTDVFQIRTLVCSTKLTHNVELMGLLKWRENPAELERHLLSFMKVDGEEVVKFLQDVLDALFNILMSNTDSEIYDNLVFDALIFIIGLTSDRKYHQFRPVLDVYIKENFSATLAYSKLMVVLKSYVESVYENQEKTESCLHAMKSLEYIFKFIIRSRLLFAALNDGRGKEQFELSLKQVFQAIITMMEQTSESVLTIQGATLQYIHTIISDVMTVLYPEEFSRILVELLQRLPKDRLVKQKILCMNNIVHSKLFKLSECRNVILPIMMSNVYDLLEHNLEQEVCVNILSDTMELLHSEDVGSITEDIKIVSLTVLRSVIQTVIHMERHSPLIGNFVAVMTSILCHMTNYHYDLYINDFPQRIDLIDFLMEILMVFQDLVTNNVYPADWNEMIMLQNSVFLKAMQHFAKTIQEQFQNPFEQQVWNNFFHCGISFLTQQPLQLENFTTAKRSKIISKYSDMRRATAFEIRSMWYNLGQHKISFIPDLVGHFLEMTLIPEIELRKATIPIFFDMMQCEFTSLITYGSRSYQKGNFQAFEHEIIMQLDALVEGGRGDEAYRELFYSIMMQLCRQHSTMSKDGEAFVEIIKELLTLLLEYRDVIQGDNRENKMSCTVNLLNFYEGIHKEEMYVRYLHKLCELHLECDNYTEAAYTLLLYAGKLEWSDTELPIMLRSSKYPDLLTHRSLKEKIYIDMIGYFHKGHMWEKGIELSKELSNLYENETFDYIQLSQTLKTQAEFYEFIMKSARPEPEYYRVGFYGKGFPPFLQNKEFVYRGKNYERISDFTSRLINQNPNARLLKTMNMPTDEIKQSPQQYLQIIPVTPIMDPMVKFTNKKVRDQIMKFYKSNWVQKFTFSRRKDDRNDDVSQMWLECTNLVIKHPLPGILQWFPIVSTHQFELSPLQNAIDTLESTNQRIKSLIDYHQISGGVGKQLSGLLSGMIEAAVGGGIANYKIFYSPQYLVENSSQRDKTLVRNLKQVTTKQMVLLQTGLDIFGHLASEVELPLHSHLEDQFSKIKTTIEEEYGIKLKDVLQKECPKPKRTLTMPPQRSTEDDNGPHSASNKMLATRMAQSVFVRGNNSATNLNTDNKLSRKSSRQHDSPTKFYTKVMSGDSPRNSSDLTAEGTLGRASRTTSSPPKSTSTSRSGSIVIELSEQLTPARPLRPESDRRSRSMSSNLSKSLNRLSSMSGSSSSTTASSASFSIAGSNIDIDEPPPLPEKRETATLGRIKSKAIDPPELSNNRLTQSSGSLDQLPDEAPLIPPKKPSRPPTQMATTIVTISDSQV